MTDWKTRVLQQEDGASDSDKIDDTPEPNSDTQKLFRLEERLAIALEQISENLVKLIKALQTASETKPEEEVKEESEEKEEEEETEEKEEDETSEEEAKEVEKEEERSGLND